MAACEGILENSLLLTEDLRLEAVKTALEHGVPLEANRSCTAARSRWFPTSSAGPPDRGSTATSSMAAAARAAALALA